MFPIDPCTALKIIQDRQAELNNEIRRVLYLKQEMEIVSDLDQQKSERRGWQHKWFGSKRLYTSAK